MYETIPEVHSPPAVTRRPIAWVTWSLAGSTLAVFLVQLYYNHLRGEDVVGEALAFGSDAVAEHRYWTVLTYAWAHAVSIFGNPWFFGLHLGLNVAALLWFGPAVEELLGHVRFLGLYLGGAVAAVLCWYLSSPAEATGQGIIGSSGAVFAVVAALGMLAPSDWEMMFFPRPIPLGRNIRLVVLAMCGFEVLPLIFHWMPEVAHSAHLGGAAFGFLYVMIFCRRGHAVCSGGR